MCSPTVGGGGKRGDRQKRIFCSSHLLGGDPEEATLCRLWEALKRKLTHTAKHYPHLTEIFSDNSQYSWPHITSHKIRCSLKHETIRGSVCFHYFLKVKVMDCWIRRQAGRPIHAPLVFALPSICLFALSCHTVCTKTVFTLMHRDHGKYHEGESVMTG